MNKLKSVELEPGLYLVATPIGNLRDVTLRALDVLKGADLVLCEDTRVTGRLFEAYDIETKKLSYNDHNAEGRRGQVLARLAAGESVALVSDAGTPLISDPGYKLVRDCLDLGFMVTSVPGANAPLSALQLSGLPSDKFSFLGFLPPKSAARRSVLEEWKAVPGTLVVFETGPRLAASLGDMAEALGDRAAAVVREITKMYEESRRGRLAELAAHYAGAGAPRGEIVVVIGPPEKSAPDERDLVIMLEDALQTLSVKDASAQVAEQTGLPRKRLYELALELSKNGR